MHLIKTHHNFICPSWHAVQMIQLMTCAAKNMFTAKLPTKQVSVHCLKTQCEKRWESHKQQRTGLRQFSLLAERVEQPWNRCNQHHSSVITVQFSCQESLGNMRISTAVNIHSMRKQKIWQTSKHSLACWSSKLVLYTRDTCFPATDLSSTFHSTLPFWQMGISVANQYT